MRRLLAVLLMAPMLAVAQLPRQLTIDHETMYAYDTPCAVPEILARIKAAYRDMLKAAKYVNSKAGELNACYVELPDHGALLFVFDDGSSVALPEKRFVREPPMVKGQAFI